MDCSIKSPPPLPFNPNKTHFYHNTCNCPTNNKRKRREREEKEKRKRREREEKEKRKRREREEKEKRKRREREEKKENCSSWKGPTTII